MNVEVISVGTEILLGDIINSDAQMLSQELAKIGINVYYHTVVGDNKDRLKEALEIAKKRVDIIITTGGLGPTYDDLTKEIIAETFGKELVFDEKSFEHIEKYFKNGKIKMTTTQRKQAMLPEGCTPFYNDWGTAPGCGFKSEKNYVLMLPGPPKECKPMFLYRAIPYLHSLTDGVIHSVSLKMFGIGESQVEEILREKMVSYTNPTIAPYAKQGECLVRVTAKAEDLAKANDMIKPVREDIYNILGQYIYGEDEVSLEEVVMQRLIDKKITVSCAESCTGGLLAKRMTDMAGVSPVFLGSVCTYSNESKVKLVNVNEDTLKQHGAVSQETAREMAKGVSEVFKSDIGVSTTGIAGPTGGTEEKPLGLVYVCVYYKGEYFEKEITGYRNRESTRLKASSVALDMIRNILQK
ncbi:MAG: competence/damage-inducible protein A [Clostridia bacterium]